MEIITVDNFSFRYTDSKNDSLNNINIGIDEGDFVLICGKSGCGKTTLVKNLKPVMIPNGTSSGRILYRGKDINTLSPEEAAINIGYVMQDTDTQIVTDKVWHELAFGLENMGLGNKLIKRRVAEISNYFGITEWFDKKTSELSGGQRQILTLASIMVMKPEVLILDEPASQLCEVAASELVSILKRINEELSTTIIMIEHRLENVFSVADKVLYMEAGKVTAYGATKDVAAIMAKSDYIDAMPASARIYKGTGLHGGNIPLNIRDGRRYVKKYFVSGLEKKNFDEKDFCTDTSFLGKILKDKKEKKEDCSISLSEVSFRYEKTGADIISNLSMNVRKGLITTVVGGNGSGKTTLLSVMAGLLKPYRGKIRTEGKIAMLPQNPETLFSRDRVYDELGMVFSKENDKNLIHRLVCDMAEKFDIEHCLDMHPYDMSGGEKQRTALAKLLLTSPEILLLDEPTKGFDYYHKKKLGSILRNLVNEGMTILIVSHDTEFTAKYSDVCMMYFNGGIVCRGTPFDVFKGNSFYTTAADRIAGDYFVNALTVEDVIEECLKITT